MEILDTENTDWLYQVICDTLSNSEQLIRRWMELGKKLKLPTNTLVQIENQVNDESISLSDALCQILTQWWRHDGSKAKVLILCNLFDDWKLKDVSDSLKEKLLSDRNKLTILEPTQYLKDDLDISLELKGFLNRKPVLFPWKTKKQQTILIMTTKVASITEERLKRHANLHVTTEKLFKDGKYPCDLKCVAFTTRSSITTLFDFLKKGPIKVVIITEQLTDVVKLRNIVKENRININLHITHDSVSWEELCEEAKNKVMYNKIDFQGRKLPLKDFLGIFGINEVNANKHIEESILVDLFKLDIQTKHKMKTEFVNPCATVS